MTQGKEIRTATVTAVSKTEVLSLHKHDYDYFVRDLQETERLENFQILSLCRLFKAWPKGKIDSICNTCLRKTFEPGAYIFRQGDNPENLYVVVEGTVSIFKELVIVCKNRWPVAMRKWKQRVCRVTEPIMLKALQRGDFFGEAAILKNQVRSTSAIAATRCVLISLSKLEFQHSVHQISTQVASIEEEEQEIQKAIQRYIGDEEARGKIEANNGGPSSAAFVGALHLNKTAIDHRLNVATHTVGKAMTNSRPGTASVLLTNTSRPFSRQSRSASASAGPHRARTAPQRDKSGNLLQLPLDNKWRTDVTSDVTPLVTVFSSKPGSRQKDQQPLKDTNTMGFRDKLEHARKK